MITNFLRRLKVAVFGEPTVHALSISDCSQNTFVFGRTGRGKDGLDWDLPHDADLLTIAHNTACDDTEEMLRCIATGRGGIFKDSSSTAFLVAAACSRIAYAAESTDAGRLYVKLSGRDLSSPEGIRDLLVRNDLLMDVVSDIIDTFEDVTTQSNVSPHVTQELAGAVEFMMSIFPAYPQSTKTCVQEHFQSLTRH